MSISKLLLSCLVSSGLVACTPTKKSENFAKNLTQVDCENAYLNMPENATGLKFIRKTQEATGTAFHYAATGVGYLAEFTVYVSAGVLMVAVACAPAVLAASMGGAADGCIPYSFVDMKDLNVPLGKKASRATENWTCANVDPLSQQVRGVAACFSKRGGEDDKKAALSTLENFKKSDSLYRCLSEEEKALLTKDIFSLKTI